MDKLYSPAQKLSTLINENPLILMTMSRFGISLGFGDKTVEAICREQDIDCGTFLAVVNFVTFGTVDLHGVNLASLLSYLKNAHTYFLEFCLPRIRRKLIESLDCSGSAQVSMLILKFYDNYSEEVRRHMEYEDSKVFSYVESLLDGHITEDFSIAEFSEHHHSIHNKLNELKEIIIRHLPQRDNPLLNTVLFDIINCEHDLGAHCRVEDTLFVPLVEALEKQTECHNPDSSSATKQGATETTTELSPRERDIIACVASGMSNKEIADKLFISVNTVTTHRRNIAQKLEIHSAAGLAIYAVINGIVDIKDLKTD